jgi:hypothetical protein
VERLIAKSVGRLKGSIQFVAGVLVNTCRVGVGFSPVDISVSIFVDTIVIELNTANAVGPRPRV